MNKCVFVLEDKVVLYQRERSGFRGMELPCHFNPS